MSSHIVARFQDGVRVAGEPLGRWTADLDAGEGVAPRALVYGIDLARVTRPRAVRAVIHQRMVRLQLEVQRNPWRRVVVLALVEDGCDALRACAGFGAAAESVHRRVETTQGRPFGLAVVVAPRTADADRLRLRVVEGASTVPDGGAAVMWQEVEARGLRQAVIFASV